MAEPLKHTRGDTLSWACVWTVEDEDGATVPLDLTGASLSADLRNANGVLLAKLTAAIDDGTDGTFLLEATAATTAAWAPGSYSTELELVIAGEVISSDPFVVRIVADHTRP